MVVGTIQANYPLYSDLEPQPRMPTASTSEPAVPKSLDLPQVLLAYAKGLVWVILAFALALGVTIVTQLILVDFVRGNPYRTKENALVMMALFPAIFSVVAAIGCVLAFGPSLLVQAGGHALLIRFGRRSVLIGTALLLPILAIMTWYCWDYLTPSDVNLGINEGADWRPYRHGITFPRYASALAFQAAVTCFSVLHCNPGTVRTTRRTVVACTLLVAAAMGAYMGVRMADGQYRFLSLEGTSDRITTQGAFSGRLGGSDQCRPTALVDCNNFYASCERVSTNAAG